MDKNSKNTEERGLICRECGYQHFRVIYTRPAWDRKLVRRRECRHCGTRMTTWERPLAGTDHEFAACPTDRFTDGFPAF